jgi:hypothetical protein
VWHSGGSRTRRRIVMPTATLVEELTDQVCVLAKKLRKQPGKRLKPPRSRRDGKLSGGLAPLPGMTRLGTLEAMHMPKVAVRPLRSSSSRFPHASLTLESDAGKQETAPKGQSKKLISLRKFGAGEGIRTLDPNLGKVMSPTSARVARVRAVHYSNCIAPSIFSPIASTAWWRGEAARWA